MRDYLFLAFATYLVGAQLALCGVVLRRLWRDDFDGDAASIGDAILAGVSRIAHDVTVAACWPYHLYRVVFAGPRQCEGVE